MARIPSSHKILKTNGQLIDRRSVLASRNSRIPETSARPATRTPRLSTAALLITGGYLEVKRELAVVLLHDDTRRALHGLRANATHDVWLATFPPEPA